jgi:hypothetical protein
MSKSVESTVERPAVNGTRCCGARNGCSAVGCAGGGGTGAGICAEALDGARLAGDGSGVSDGEGSGEGDAEDEEGGEDGEEDVAVCAAD